MLRDRLRGVKQGIERRVREKLEDLSTAAAGVHGTAEDSGGRSDLVKTPENKTDLETSQDDPPVVARLMVEIRSDGTRTIARGALKDELSGEQVSLLAKGSSPLSLAAQLAKSLLTTPLAAAQLSRAMKRAQLAESKNKPPPPDEP